MKRSTSRRTKRSFAALPLVTLLLVLPAAGCSLTGITDYEPWSCKTDDDCLEAFNKGNGYHALCHAFSCESRGKRRDCVRIPEEIFDGYDNDCDYLIDESVDGKTVVEVGSTKLAGLTSRPTSVSVASSAKFGDFAYVTGDDAEQQSKVVPTLVPLSKGETRVAQMVTTPPPPNNAENYTLASLSALEAGCYTPAACDLETEGCRSSLNVALLDDCTVAELAAVATDEFGLFTAVQTSGCESGELYVGVLDSVQPEELVVRGRGQRNPTYRGVSTRGTRCSGNLTEACESAKSALPAAEDQLSAAEDELFASCGVRDPDLLQDPSQECVSLGTTVQTAKAKATQLHGEVGASCGASRPAIAGLGSQGLVAYLGVSSNDQSIVDQLGVETSSDACVPETPVLGLGLQVSGNSTEGVFANPSGDGEPTRLGTTNGGAPPAILALDERGYLVAFGVDNGIDLIWVPQSSPYPRGTDLTYPEYEMRDGFSTPALTFERILHIESPSQTGGISDGVALAALDASDDSKRLAVTWVDGCARERQLSALSPLWAQVLTLDLSTDPPTASTDDAPVVSLGKTNRAPTLAPSTCDFVVRNFQRQNGKGPKAGEDVLGGFVVLGKPNKRAKAFRLAAFDGDLVDASEEVLLASEEEFLSATPDGRVLSFDAASSSLRELTFCAK